MGRVAAAERELRAWVERDPALRASTGRRLGPGPPTPCRTATPIAREWAMLDGRGSRALEFALGLARWKAEAARPRAQRDLGYRTARDYEILAASLALPGDAGSPGSSRPPWPRACGRPRTNWAPTIPSPPPCWAAPAPADRARALVAGTRLLDPGDPAGPVPGLGGGGPGQRRPPRWCWRVRLEQLAEPYRRREEAAGGGDRRPGRPHRPGPVRPVRQGGLPGRQPQPAAQLRIGGPHSGRRHPGAAVHHLRRAVRPRRRLGTGGRGRFLGPAAPVAGAPGGPGPQPAAEFHDHQRRHWRQLRLPVVDPRGQLVGLVFDSNLASIAGRYYYDPGTQRAVCVDARAILAALEKVYDAPGLAAELRGGD